MAGAGSLCFNKTAFGDVKEINHCGIKFCYSICFFGFKRFGVKAFVEDCQNFVIAYHNLVFLSENRPGALD